MTEGTTTQELTAEDWRRWHDSLRPLERNARIGPAAREAFRWIWLVCWTRHRGTASPGAELLPGQVVTENLRFFLDDLGNSFSRTRRSAERWIRALSEAGLVYEKHYGRDGWITLDVYHPNPDLRSLPAPADPQLTFSFVGDEPPAVLAPKPRQGCRQNRGNVGAKTAALLAEQHVEDIGRQAASAQLTMGEAARAIASDPREANRGPPKRRSPNIRYPDSGLGGDGYCGNGQKSDQESLENTIHRLMADPLLQAIPVAKVAQRVMLDQLGLQVGKLEEGYNNRPALKWEEVKRAIHLAKQTYRDLLGTDKAIPGPYVYWVGAMKKAFEQRGLAWSKLRSGATC